MKSFFKGKKVLLAIAIVIFLATAVITKNQHKVQNVAGVKSQDTISPANSPAITQQPSDTDSINNTIKGETATVVKVVDGDTLSVSFGDKNETVRIIGINSPETVDVRKPVECFGQKASEIAKSELTGKTVQLEQDPTQGDRDKYSRLLRYVWLDANTDFGALMVKSGYAYEYTYNTPYKYQNEYKALQKEAAENKSGLWADNACPAKITPSATSSQTSQKPSSTSTPKTSDDKNCPDFKTHAEAQNYFSSKGGSATNNVDGLDNDHDGIACESLL